MSIAVTDGRISQMIAAGVGAGGPCSRWERRSHPWSGRDCGRGAPPEPAVRRDQGALTLGVARDCGRGAPPEPAVRRDQETYFEVKLPPKPK